jgi:hypothetical protein
VSLTIDRGTSRRDQRTIPDGQEIDVRLERELSSATAQVEDRFEATTVVDLYDGNRSLIPAGSVMRGVVSSVDKASRTDRKGSLTVAFDQVTVRGRDYPMRGTVTQALESEGIRGEVGRIAAGSGIGAIIGGILGGAKGAVLGVLIGGGGTIAATEGKDVTLPPGTILRSGLTPARHSLSRGGANLAFIARWATFTVLSTSFSLCAADRNHAELRGRGHSASHDAEERPAPPCRP